MPLNKMTRKQLLSELRKRTAQCRESMSEVHSQVVALERERDDFRQSLNGALEEIATLKGRLAARELI